MATLFPQADSKLAPGTVSGANLQPLPVTDEFAGFEPAQTDEFAGFEAAQPTDEFSQFQSAKPTEYLKPEDLSDSEKFDLTRYVRDNPDALQDPVQRKQLLEASRQRRVRGLELGKVVSKAIPEVPGLIGSVAKGFRDYTARLIEAGIQPTVNLVAGAITNPSQISSIIAETKKNQKQAIAEMAAGSELAATGLVDLGRTGVRKLRTSAKEWAEASEADLEAALRDDADFLTTTENARAGKGIAVKTLGLDADTLAKQGIEIDPDLVESLSLADPIQIIVPVKGAQLLGRLAKSAAAATGVVMVNKAGQVVGVAPSVAKAMEIGRKIGAPIVDATKAAPGTAVKVAGKAVELGGKAVEKVGEVGRGPLKVAAGIAGVVKGAEIGGAAGAAVGGVAAAAAAGRVATGIVKTGQAAQRAGQNIIAFGHQLTGAAEPGRVLRTARAIAAPVAPVAKGAAVGAVAAAPLAAAADTNEQAAALLAGGLALGGLGGAAVGAHKGITGLRERVVGGRLLDPFDRTALPEVLDSPAYGLIPDLDQVHEAQFGTLGVEGQATVNGFRELFRGDGELYLQDGANYYQRVLEIMELEKGSPLTAEEITAAGQFANTHAVATASYNTPNGPRKVVFLNQDAKGLPHDAGHLFESILDEPSRQALLDEVGRRYTVEEANALRAQYEAALNQGIDPSDPTYRRLSDEQLASEIIAENFSALFSNAPLETLGTPRPLVDRLVQTVATYAEKAGIDLTGGRTTPNLPVKPSFGVRGMIENAVRERISRVQPQPQAAPTVQFQQPPTAATAATAAPTPTAPSPITTVTPTAAATSTAAAPTPTAPAPAPQSLASRLRNIRVTPGEQAGTAAGALESARLDVGRNFAAKVGDPNLIKVVEDLAAGFERRPGQVSPVELEVLGAKEFEPGKPTGRLARLEERVAADAAEAAGSAPQDVRNMFQKGFVPVRFETVGKGAGQKLEILGMSLDKVLANVNIVNKAVTKKGIANLLPYEVVNGNLTETAWRRLQKDLVAYTENQQNGFRGDGKPLTRPTPETGASIPPENPNYRPTLLPEEVGNYLNLLQGLAPPKTARVSQPGVPGNVKARRIAEVNLRPVEPPAQIAPSAQGKQTFPTGEVVGEVNPLRQALSRQGVEIRDLHEVTERLRVDRIKSVKPRPELGFKAPVTDVVRAGFLPRELEQKRVVSAALRTPRGEIITGASHPDAFLKGLDAGQILETDNLDDGFVDGSGNFLSRDEAFQRAVEIRQVAETDLTGGLVSQKLESKEFRAAANFLPADLDSMTDMTWRRWENWSTHSGKAEYLKPFYNRSVLLDSTPKEVAAMRVWHKNAAEFIGEPRRRRELEALPSGYFTKKVADHAGDPRWKMLVLENGGAPELAKAMEILRKNDFRKLFSEGPTPGANLLVKALINDWLREAHPEAIAPTDTALNIGTDPFRKTGFNSFLSLVRRFGQTDMAKRFPELALQDNETFIQKYAAAKPDVEKAPRAESQGALEERIESLTAEARQKAAQEKAKYPTAEELNDFSEQSLAVWEQTLDVASILDRAARTQDPQATAKLLIEDYVTQAVEDKKFADPKQAEFEVYETARMLTELPDKVRSEFRFRKIPAPPEAPQIPEIPASAKFLPEERDKALRTGQLPDKNPAKPSPDENVRKVAQAYAKSAGIDYQPTETFTKIPADLAVDLADAFEQAVSTPDDPAVRAAYDALKAQTLEQYRAMEAAGVKVEPFTGEGEPYKSSADMVADVRDNKHLYFLKSEGAFGGGEGHPMLENSGVDIAGQPVPFNDLFRAVHDYFGHAKEGYQFGPQGEFNAWRAHSEMFTPEAQGALAEETLMQNAWVNNGPHMRNAEGKLLKKGEEGYLPPIERPFAEQKVFLPPPELIARAREAAQSGAKFLPAELSPETVGTFAEDVSKMSTEEFVEFAKTLPAGITGKAVELGKLSRNQDAVNNLVKLQEEASVKSKAAMKAGDFDAAMTEATRTQFFREAMETATNTGSMGKALADRGEDFLVPPPAKFLPRTTKGVELEGKGYEFKHMGFPGTRSIQIIKNDEVVGQIFSHQSNPELATVDNVLVEPSLRKQGLGEALYRELGSVLQEDGVKRLGGYIVAEGPLEIRQSVFGDFLDLTSAMGDKVTPEQAASTLRRAAEGGRRDVDFFEATSEIRPDAKFLPKEEEKFVHLKNRGSVLTSIDEVIGPFNSAESAAAASKTVLKQMANQGLYYAKASVVDSPGEKRVIGPAQYRIADDGSQIHIKGAADFLPKKKQAEKLPLVSKSFILPNGAFQEVNRATHDQYLIENSESLNKTFKTTIPAVQGKEDVRVGALASGFVRISYTPNNGRLVIEANDGKFGKVQRDKIQDYITENLDGIDNLTISLVDNQGKVKRSASRQFFQMDDDAEKLASIPFITDERTGQREGFAAFLPKSKAEELQESLTKFPVNPEAAPVEALKKLDLPKGGIGDSGWVLPDGSFYSVEKGQKVYHDDWVGKYEQFTGDDVGGSVEGFQAGTGGMRISVSNSLRALDDYGNGSVGISFTKAPTPKQISLVRRMLDEKSSSRELDPMFKYFSVDVMDPEGSVKTVKNFTILGKTDRARLLKFLQDPGAGPEPYTPRVPDALMGELLQDLFGGEERFTITQRLSSDHKQKIQKEATRVLNEKLSEDEFEQLQYGTPSESAAVGLKAAKFVKDALKESDPEFIQDLDDKLDIHELLPREARAAFLPRGKEQEAFKFEVSPTGKKTLTKAQRAELTLPQLRQQYPEAVVPRAKDDTVDYAITESPRYKQAKTEEAAVKAFSEKLVEKYNKHKDNPITEMGKRWYEDFIPLLKARYGKDAPIFAELLAATSPNTTPKVNFGFAEAAFKRWKNGDFDALIKKYEEGLEKLADGSLEKQYKRAVPAAQQPQKISDAALMGWWIQKHDLLPKQVARMTPEGLKNPKFGMHSEAVLKVITRRWLKQTQGPKTQNFVNNLLGTSDAATIDLWAARTMREAGYKGYVDRWRVLPQHAKGVSDADFAFSQKAFAAAADKLGMKPRELQGALWFAEKVEWAEKGWSELNLGDFRQELKDLELKEAQQELF